MERSMVITTLYVLEPCVISDDDLLHIFWHTGDYYVYDLYESGMYILAGYRKVSGSSISYYQVTDVNDTHIVKGTSAPNAAFHSCIIDKKYFYQYGQTGKKLLMTRKQFEEIVNGKEDPTPTPTATPTATPTPSCDCKNGGTCNCPVANVHVTIALARINLANQQRHLLCLQQQHLMVVVRKLRMRMRKRL